MVAIPCLASNGKGPKCIHTLGLPIAGGVANGSNHYFARIGGLRLEITHHSFRNTVVCPINSVYSFYLKRKPATKKLTRSQSAYLYTELFIFFVK